MINKDFTPYQEAFELKDLGFDEECLGYYNIDPYFKNPSFRAGTPFDHQWCLPAPTYSQAFRWFRDNKLSDMCVCRYQGREDGGVYYYYAITHDFGIEEVRYFKEGFFTYEEAEVACLKKLIEIVKTYGGNNNG